MSRSTATALSLCVPLIAIPSLISASMLWSGIYQINPAYNEWFRGAAPVVGGDWVVVGTIGENYPVLPEIRITRIDKTGEVLWDKQVTGDPPQLDDENISRGVAASPDGGCVTVAEIVVAGGLGAGDVLLTKWRFDGTVEWHKLIGTDGNEFDFRIAQAAGGGFFVFGRSTFDAFSCLHVLKFREDGVLIWQRQFGDADVSLSTYGYSPLAATSDGGCVFLGQSHTNVVVKLASDGSVEWMREIDGPSSFDFFYSVSQDPRGGYIIAGYLYDPGELWLLRLIASGVIDWQKRMSVGLSAGYGAVGIDDGYLVTGLASGNNWFVRTDLSGDIVWQRSYTFDAGVAIAANIVLGPEETFVGIGRDYKSAAGWFLRAPISSGTVGGCIVNDTAADMYSVDNVTESDYTVPVAVGTMGIDDDPAVAVFDLSANRLVDCSEINPYVMADDFESGDFSGWSDFFE